MTPVQLHQTPAGDGRASFQIRRKESGELLAEITLTFPLWHVYMIPRKDAYGRVVWSINGTDAVPVGGYDRLPDALRDACYLIDINVLAGP